MLLSAVTHVGLKSVPGVFLGVGHHHPVSGDLGHYGRRSYGKTGGVALYDVGLGLRYAGKLNSIDQNMLQRAQMLTTSQAL